MRNYEGTSGTDGLGADSDPSDGIRTRMETDSGERTNRGEEQPTAGTTECVVDSDKEAICRTPPEDEREELANIQRGLHPVAGKRRKRGCGNESDGGDLTASDDAGVRERAKPEKEQKRVQKLSEILADGFSILSDTELEDFRILVLLQPISGDSSTTLAITPKLQTK